MNPTGCGGDDDSDSAETGAPTDDDDASAADDDAADDDAADDDAADDDAADDDAADDDVDDDTGDDDTADDTADDDTTNCLDLDGDGYGTNCPAGEDCDDNDPTRWVEITPYRDADYDTYAGTLHDTICSGATLPSGWSLVSTDCDDNDPTINPGMFDFPDDGIDNDCVGGDAATSDYHLFYVDVAAGDDANPGTPAQPMKTVSTGVFAAELAGADGVAVAQGTYTEDVVTTVSLFGGYEGTTWTRDLSPAVPVTRLEPFAADTTITVSGAAGPIAVHGFRIDVPDAVTQARGVAVENSQPVWIGANVIQGGSAVSVRGIQTQDSLIWIVGNQINLENVEEATGIWIDNLTTNEPTYIFSNSIFVDIESGSAVYGIRAVSDLLIVDNDIAINATADAIIGISGYAVGGHLSASHWGPAVIDNEIAVSGSGWNQSGIYLYSFAFPSYTGSRAAIGNRIAIDSTGGEVRGITSPSTARNEIDLVCRDDDYPCTGIYSWMFGIHRQNSIWMKTSSDLSELVGISVSDFFFGLVYGSVIDNTIYISDNNSVNYGISLYSFPLFIPYGTSYVNADIINNNVVVPTGNEAISVHADRRVLAQISNNAFAGSPQFNAATGGPDVSVRSHPSSPPARADLSVDPLFMDPEYGDLRLRPESPLIDVGFYDPFPMLFLPIVAPIWNEEWNRFPRDVDGTWRPQGTRMDIGADEYAP